MLLPLTFLLLEIMLDISCRKILWTLTCSCCCCCYLSHYPDAAVPPVVSAYTAYAVPANAAPAVAAAPQAAAADLSALADPQYGTTAALSVAVNTGYNGVVVSDVVADH